MVSISKRSITKEDLTKDLIQCKLKIVNTLDNIINILESENLKYPINVLYDLKQHILLGSNTKHYYIDIYDSVRLTIKKKRFILGYKEVFLLNTSDLKVALEYTVYWTFVELLKELKSLLEEGYLISDKICILNRIKN